MEGDFVNAMISQLDSSDGPVERVLAAWEVPNGAPPSSIPAGSPVHEAGYAAAFDVIDKLREQLGPTGDPSAVDDVIPGRGGTVQDGDDFVFALFRRSPAYVYVRLRAEIGTAGSQLQLVVGVVRIPRGHFGSE